MSVYAGQTLTLQGVGFEAGDVVSFRADAAVFDLPVSGVTAKTARVVIPAAIARESYDVYVVRGAQEQYVATVKIYLTTDQEVPDKEGMNIKGIVFCGDKGVPGVRVSDGLQTVTTDENGYYWIPSLKTLGYVFITIPQGYLPAALDNNMMMGFWAGLTDEAGVCEKHNFELVEADTENHVMLVGADLHLADKQNDLRNFKNGFIAETQAFADASSVPVFCLMAGDMTTVISGFRTTGSGFPGTDIPCPYSTRWATTITTPMCRATPRGSFPIAGRWGRTTIRSTSARCTTWYSTTLTGSIRAAATACWAAATTTASCRWRR